MAGLTQKTEWLEFRPVLEVRTVRFPTEDKEARLLVRTTTATKVPLLSFRIVQELGLTLEAPKTESTLGLTVSASPEVETWVRGRVTIEVGGRASKAVVPHRLPLLEKEDVVLPETSPLRLGLAEGPTDKGWQRQNRNPRNLRTSQ